MDWRPRAPPVGFRGGGNIGVTEIAALFTAGGGGPQEPGPTCGLYIQTFGGFRLYRDGQPVPSAAWRRHVAKTVLLRLLLGGGRPLPKSKLMGLLWPDAAENVAANRLRVALHALRRILEPDLPARCPSRYLLTTRYECCLADQPDLHWDGEVLLRALGAADAASGPEEEIAALEAGLSVVHGEWLPEVDGSGEFELMRWQWDGLALGAAIRLAELALDRGRASVACWAAECAASIDPGAERAYAVLLAALGAVGVPSQVRRAYDYACTRLKECLDAEPGPALRRAAADALAVARARAVCRPSPGW